MMWTVGADKTYVIKHNAETGETSEPQVLYREIKYRYCGFIMPFWDWLAEDNELTLTPEEFEEGPEENDDAGT